MGSSLLSYLQSNFFHVNDLKQKILSSKTSPFRSFHRSYSSLIHYNIAKIQHDPTHVYLKKAPSSFDVSSAVVYPDFLSEDESRSLLKEVSKRMKHRLFEGGHWDSVITNYREVELPIPEEEVDDENKFMMEEKGNGTENSMDDYPMFANTIKRTRQLLEDQYFASNEQYSNDSNYSSRTVVKWLPCHAIDLSKKGRLDAHVDSVKFSGEIVAGLSLLSDSIMRLKPSSEEWKSGNLKKKDLKQSKEIDRVDSTDLQEYVDLYLPQLSLYVLSGMSRYEYTHELLPSDSIFEIAGVENSECEIEKKSRENYVAVKRGRRLSIIFRDAPHSRDKPQIAVSSIMSGHISSSH